MEKLFGPTFEDSGGDIQKWVRRKKTNIDRICAIAIKRLGSKLDEKGVVPPRVLKGIMTEGAFCEDELAAEYFGGVLASSRSGISRDDRGATIIALISRLSTYQLRGHYIMYHIVKLLFDGSELVIRIGGEAKKMMIYIPERVYAAGIGIDQGEDIAILLPHIMYGLFREYLIEENFAFARTEHIQKNYARAQEPGILFIPSILGTELFLWAYGKGDCQNQTLLDPSVLLPINGDIKILPGFSKVYE